MKSYQCSCGAINNENDIDDATLALCVNRQQRRAYKPIGMTTNISKKWYRCPNCGGNIRRKDWKLV